MANILAKYFGNIGGEQLIGGVDNQLAQLMAGGGNFIRNDQTGGVTRLGSSQAYQPSQRGSVVDVSGQGRGYLQPDGTIVGTNAQGQRFVVQPEGTVEAQRQARMAAEDRAMKIAEFNKRMQEGQSGQKAPAGYQFKSDGTLEPIAGGPADFKRQQMEIEQKKATDNAAVATQQMLDQAELLYMHPGREAATGASSFLRNVPGTSAKGFDAQLETFKAQTFIPMVSALKGMGALSDAEGKKLAASVGALDPSMPEKEFADSLKSVMKYLYDKAQASGLNVTAPTSISGNSTTPQTGGYSDAGKEARYQAWKASQGR